MIERTCWWMRCAALAAGLCAAVPCAAAEPALCTPPSVTLSDGPYVQKLMEDLVAARTMVTPSGCTSVAGKGAYAGHRIDDCEYATTGRRRIVERKGKLEAVPESETAEWKGRVLMLNASADVLAQWTREACEAAGKEMKNCALDICDYVKNQSAAQFPVKGIVIEPDRSLNAKGGTDGDVSVFFRDGVTVATAKSRAFARSPEVSGKSHPGRELTPAEIEEALGEEYTALREIKPYSRVGGITADCYQRIKDKDAKAEGGKKEPEDPVIENGKPSLRWLEVSRDTYLAALANPEDGYEMFRILARVLKRKGEAAGGFDLACK